MPKTHWTLRGRLLFEPASQIAGQFSNPVPLSGVRVKVSAKQFAADPTGWQKWDEGATDEDGYFELSNFKDQTARLFRVRVQFKDDDLKVFPENDSVFSKVVSTGSLVLGPLGPVAVELIEQALEQFTRITYKVPWLTVFEAHGNDEKENADDVNFGSLIFQAGGEEQLGVLDSRRHAEIWYVAKRAINLLNGYAPGLGFTEQKPIAVKYPHDNPWIGDGIELPYADPHNDTVFLIRNSTRDDFDVETLLHEIGHLHMYQHTTQEERMMYAIPGGTHATRENTTHVPCIEAYAETFKNEVYRKLFDGKPRSFSQEAKRLPFSRTHLVARGCTSLADADHFERWWFSFFNLLLCDRLKGVDLNKGSLYATPNQFKNAALVPEVRFEDFLQCFVPDLARTQMTTEGFLARLQVSLPQVDASDADAYRTLLDPAATVQPFEAFPLTAEVSLNDPVGVSRSMSASRP